ncbi:uncharacterized protein [Zea mays]|uniref:uncharacterized protein isoform X2 n=1 Tax=Zea mays TaxID=4577 RepID=UPI0009A9FAE7|nr:uncharacterized protein LOC103650224 isoform X2 [Zea mays]|eukprot:XP_020406674.1 uncharacterized protein LOC103650224 isoform X2 [Zea mays]
MEFSPSATPPLGYALVLTSPPSTSTSSHHLPVFPSRGAQDADQGHQQPASQARAAAAPQRRHPPSFVSRSAAPLCSDASRAPPWRTSPAAENLQVQATSIFPHGAPAPISSPSSLFLAQTNFFSKADACFPPTSSPPRCKAVGKSLHPARPPPPVVVLVGSKPRRTLCALAASRPGLPWLPPWRTSRSSRDASSRSHVDLLASRPWHARRNAAASSSSDTLRCVVLARTGLTSSICAASARRRRNPRPCRRHASRIARRQRAQTNGMHARCESARTERW